MQGVLPDKEVTVDPAELEAAEALMDSFGPLAEEDVHDHLREELEEIAAAKLAQRDPHFNVAEGPGSGAPVDLMAALQDSVRQAQAARGEDQATAVSLMPPPPPKKATRKPPSTKPPAGQAKSKTTGKGTSAGLPPKSSKKTAAKRRSSHAG